MHGSVVCSYEVDAESAGAGSAVLQRIRDSLSETGVLTHASVKGTATLTGVSVGPLPAFTVGPREQAIVDAVRVLKGELMATRRGAVIDALRDAGAPVLADAIAELVGGA